MANPAKKLESLLRLHRFELVSQRKHLKYKNPQGKIFVMGKTPGDFRADHKALSVFQRVVDSPVPTSEVVEEERQRRELEATIRLRPQPKPSTAGIAGAGRGKKSKGTGIHYEEKIVPTAEQLAHREKMRERALANQTREYEKWRERREERRKRDEWARLLSHLRKVTKQVEKDVDEIYAFFMSMVMLGSSRSMTAQLLLMRRREGKGREYGPEERRRLVDAVYVENYVAASSNNEEYRSAIVTSARTDLAVSGQFLMYRAGRNPRWFPPENGESLNLDARQFKLMRRTLSWHSRIRIEGADGAITQARPVPEWLANALESLQVGVNVIEAVR